MRRSLVLPSLAVIATVLSQLTAPALPAGHVDPVALAAATAAASWHCALPHRQRDNRIQARSTGPAPLEVTEPAPGERRPGADSQQDGSGSAARPIDGLGTGVGLNPRADISGVLTDSRQTDTYQVPMRAGEVFGATVLGAGLRLEVYDPAGELVAGSATDRSASYPASSTLPAGGNATVDHVAAATGTYVLAVRRGTGTYQVRLEIRQPPSVGAQRIVLEFGGASVDTTTFGVQSPGGQPRRVSPLRDFLPRWGLRESDEPALIRRITDTVAENLRGGAGTGVGSVQVTASKLGQPAENFGRPNVSRVVIGGTRAETGLDTVGLAESVDPGNLAREETAVVLLDSLSGPAGYPDSLNHYLASSTDRIGFIGRAVGNIVSHEAGHLLGSWHTDPNSGRHDLMAPGDLIGAFGFGADQVGGTADDTRSKFDQDAFAPAEGFTGTEDTRNRTTVGLGGGTDSSAG